MRKLLTLLSAISLAMAMLVLSPAAAAASGPEDGPELVGVIHGQGRADMDAGKGPSTFKLNVKLFSDGSARGHVVCVDVKGDPLGDGVIAGDATSWTQDKDGVVTLIMPHGIFSALNGQVLNPNTYFTMSIQRFGGAGVGHWTMNFGHSPTPFCVELLTRGHIVGNGEIFRQRDEE